MTNEARTAEAQIWLAPGLAISGWVQTEFSSALAIKIPTGQIDAGHRADALAMLTRLVLDSFVVLPVAGEYFRAAANFVDQFRLGLGAGDALHLAICAAHGAALCTLDRQMAEAGLALGVKTKLV